MQSHSLGNNKQRKDRLNLARPVQSLEEPVSRNPTITNSGLCNSLRPYRLYLPLHRRAAIATFSLGALVGGAGHAEPPQNSQSNASPLVAALLGGSSSSTSGDLVRGQQATFNGGVSVAFPTKFEVSDGSLSYKTLKPEAAGVLVEEPVIDVPAGFQASISSLVAVPAKVPFGRGSIDGYAIQCSLLVYAKESAKPGRHDIIVALPAIAPVARAIEAIPPDKTPTLTFQVVLYESENARDQARKEVQARIESERRAHAEKRRQEEALRAKAAEEEAREARRTHILVGLCAGALILFLLLGAYVRAWLFPKHRIRVRPGMKATGKGAVEKKKDNMQESEIGEEPPPFLQTKHARSFWGRRSGVTVDLTAISADCSINRVTTTTTDSSGSSYVSVSFERITRYQVRIEATALASTVPGKYTAWTEAGVVCVHVN